MDYEQLGQTFTAVADNMKEMVDPLLENASRVVSGHHERGIPVLHADLGKSIIFDKVECEKHVDDPQCKHETLNDSPM